MSPAIEPSPSRLLDRLEMLTAALDTAADDLAVAETVFVETVADIDTDATSGSLVDVERAAAMVAAAEARLVRIACLVLWQVASITRRIGSAAPIVGRRS